MAEAARKFPEINRGRWHRNGKTPRCRVCRARGIDVSKAFHRPACRKPYAEFIKNFFDPAKFLFDEAQAELENGDKDLGERGFDREAELELPEGPSLDEELQDYEHMNVYDIGTVLQAKSHVAARNLSSTD